MTSALCKTFPKHTKISHSSRINVLPTADVSDATRGGRSGTWGPSSHFFRIGVGLKILALGLGIFTRKLRCQFAAHGEERAVEGSGV